MLVFIYSQNHKGEKGSIGYDTANYDANHHWHLSQPVRAR